MSREETIAAIVAELEKATPPVLEIILAFVVGLATVKKESCQNDSSLFLVFGSVQLVGEVGHQFPLFGGELGQHGDKPALEILFRITQDGSHKGGDLLLAVNGLEHLSLAGAQPRFVDAKFPTKENYNAVNGGVAAYFVVCDGTALNAEAVGKFLLRKAKRLSQIFYSLVHDAILLAAY